MLNIRFKTDKDFMARLIISKNNMPTDFANYLWDKYRVSYMTLQKDFQSEEIDNNIISELEKQEFFKKLCDNANNNLERIKDNWGKSKNKINLFLDNIFKKEFALNETAIIMPPTLYAGMNIGDDQFVWGHKYGLVDKNYDLVYLVHESLHSYFPNNNLTHAIIEKIADIELSKYLNNTDKPYDCHEYTKMHHIKILPFWNIYLNKSREDIEKENKDSNITYNLEDFAKYETQIKNMNIDSFTKFLEQQDLTEVKTNYTIAIKNKESLPQQESVTERDFVS